MITGDAIATSHACQLLPGINAVACQAWKSGSCHGISLALRPLQVVDSPFSKLTELMLELVEEQKIPIPRSLMRVALSMMRRSVKKRAGFSIDEVAPIDKIHTSFIPVLFGEQHVCIHRSFVAADRWLLDQIHTCFVTVLFGEQHVYISCLLVFAPALQHGAMPTLSCSAEELCSTCSHQSSVNLCGAANLCASAWTGYSLEVCKVLLQAFCADLNDWQ